MKVQRILGLMIVTAMFTACAQEKKNPPPSTMGSGQEAKPTNAAKANEKKATPDELMAKAQQALRKNDTATAIAALEELVAGEPKNREGLFLLSRVLQNQGSIAIKAGNTVAASDSLVKSAKYMKQLRAAYPKLTEEEASELPVILYNEACVLPLAGDAAPAVAALEDAFDSGFSDLNQLNTDHDLDKRARRLSSPRF